MRAPGLATLVLPDCRSLRFPPFCEGAGLAKCFLSVWASSFEWVDNFVSLSFMCFSYFPRSDPRLYGEKRGSCSGLDDAREGRKEVRVFRVATLVLLGHRSLQFYPF